MSVIDLPGVYNNLSLYLCLLTYEEIIVYNAWSNGKGSPTTPRLGKKYFLCHKHEKKIDNCIKLSHKMNTSNISVARAPKFKL